ncbi:MAG: hypothetical protein HN590_11360 [Calditrichaeota bacterium]|jgi:hypothetical protein|nr:hypothetical protein [Candidatus Neomarinimicrobiota bacterium]MBT4362044.1 hypothetical protein [Candidatus Neomarinimicrobiota bacterium]MBT6009862.1 hypothetical protein [Candidatus Neomarinimicrobiota bacterium]MBT7617870.1 hypothetical protein [Calditrichota bacterium]
MIKIDDYVYAFLHNLDYTQDGYLARWSSLPKRVVDQLDGRWSPTLAAEAPIHVLESDPIPVEQKDAWRLKEGRWYEIQLGAQGLFVGAFFLGDEVDEREPQTVRITSLNLLDGRTKIGKNIRKAISLPPEDASVGQIQLACNKNTYNNLNLAHYYVGQGDASAVCDTNWTPLCYFDIGAGSFRNGFTKPRNLKFCWTKRPAIILSHWDTDHYWGAYFDIKAHKQTWIVPRQAIGPYDLRMVNKILSAGGTLLVWGNHPSHIDVSFGRIIRCTGTNMNDSGLALIVNFNMSTHALLPGDAKFRFIPGVLNKEFHHLMAPHHGALLNTTRVPVPIGQVKSCVYSFGINNSHYHPSIVSVNALMQSEWWTRINTAGGTVGVRLNSNSSSFRKCYKQFCLQEPKQLFTL